MQTILHVLAMAPANSGSGQSPNQLLSLLPIFLMIAVMYFLIMRPNAKKQKEHKSMLETLEKGDKVMTTGGIVGIIAGIKEKENTLLVKVSDQVKLEIARSAIAQVLKKKAE